MEVKAKAKFVRMTPRKIRLVVDVVRGMDVGPALDQLSFMNKVAATPVYKLVASAVANATNNFKLDKNNLYISEITANDGPTLKRWKPRAFGRATTLLKRSAHIAIVLSEKVPTDVKKKKTEKSDKDSEDQKKKITVFCKRKPRALASG